MIADNQLESYLLKIRENLADANGKEASDKIKLLINKDEDHKHEAEVESDDIKHLSSKIKRDIEENDFESANSHSE